MKELHSEAMFYNFLLDEATGEFFLEAFCNNSAAYFTVTVKLLPSEVSVIQGKGGGGAITRKGKDLLARLSRRAQSNPARFQEQRAALWRS
jgi:hypothetical protein